MTWGDGDEDQAVLSRMSPRTSAENGSNWKYHVSCPPSIVPSLLSSCGTWDVLENGDSLTDTAFKPPPTSYPRPRASSRKSQPCVGIILRQRRQTRHKHHRHPNNSQDRPTHKPIRPKGHNHPYKENPIQHMRPSTREQTPLKKALALRQPSRVSLSFTTRIPQNEQNDEKMAEKRGLPCQPPKPSSPPSLPATTPPPASPPPGPGHAAN